MVIYGGVNAKEQKDALKAKPPHVVVGTPGRIKAVRTPRARRVLPAGADRATSRHRSWPRTAT